MNAQENKKRFLRKTINIDCKALKSLREKSKLSQAQLAKLCEFSTKTRISSYECGRVNLHYELIEEVISKMGYTMEDFSNEKELLLKAPEIVKDLEKILQRLNYYNLKIAKKFLTNLQTKRTY